MTPKGWTLDKTRPHKPYKAQLTSEGNYIYLGNFETEYEAHVAYLDGRKEYPMLPPSGGRTAGFRLPLKTCDICEEMHAISKFDMHRTACARKAAEKAARMMKMKR